jgi:hypothetical protein
VVEDTGKATGAGTYKPVNVPEPVTVEEDPLGLPRAVIMRRRQPVASIDDRWRIDDEWWRREPVSRLYYALMLGSGQRLVVYKDLVKGDWYRQAL